MRIGLPAPVKSIALAVGLLAMPYGMVIASGSAQAADATPPPAATPSVTAPSFGGTDWTMTIGAEGGWAPSYPGSGRNTLRGLPVFSIRPIGTPQRFHAPRDGLGITVFKLGELQFGPVAQIRAPRRESDDINLLGLGDVDWAVEVGGFAEFWFTPWLRMRGELRQGFGGHHGLAGDLTADVVVPVTAQWTLSAGPRASFASDAALNPYFGITAAQSAASGLPVFNAQGGARSYGAGAQARYQWTPQWVVYGFVEYDRLAGDAANSPLVTLRGSPDQTAIGLGVSYTFDIRGLWLPVPR